jgi:Protein of unknown function (DUF3386)
MTPRRSLALAFVALALIATTSRAHFLFCRITPMAEAGRAVEVTFSDRAGEGDPTFVDKIMKTKLWVQVKPGEFRQLEMKRAPDRIRAILPVSGAVGVVGVCEYGVRTITNQPAFLLRHYPKAIDGATEELNALKPMGKEVPFEIAATLTENGIRVVALRDGQPVPDAKFTTIARDLTNETIKAGSDGVALWKPAKPGVYSVYTESKLKQSGTFDGTPYEEIREFTTLTFTWPAERKGVDADAVALFEKALADRAVWVGFPGFSAEITGYHDGRAFRGKLEVSKEGKINATIDEPLAKKWLEDSLGSIVMHRQADSGAEATPALRFADGETDHPLGRLLLFDGGRFASSYRIKDGQIKVVNRHMGRSNMTLTTLDQARNAEGKSLPLSYVVQYWDATNGDLSRVETIQDRWSRVGRFDLPAERTATNATPGGLSVRSFVLKGHKLGSDPKE